MVQVNRNIKIEFSMAAETQLSEATTHLTSLSYSQPETLIQHSISLLQTFINFKLQLSTVEKNDNEYIIAQLTGPGFSLLPTGIASSTVHLWLDRDYPSEAPEVTLTDLAFPHQYLQPFYNPDTNRVIYATFYDWGRSSSIIELLFAVNKVLAHTYHAWILQIIQRPPSIQMQQQMHPSQFNNPTNIYTQQYPSIPHGNPPPIGPPLNAQMLNRMPHSQRFSAQPVSTDSSWNDSTVEDKKKRNYKRGARRAHRDMNDSEIANSDRPSRGRSAVDSKTPASLMPAAVIKKDYKGGSSTTKDEMPSESKDTNPVKKDYTTAKTFIKYLDTPMEEYISQEEANEGLLSGHMIQGPFRINQKNFEQSYVFNATDERDVIILGVACRNRAMPSDIVVVEILDEVYNRPSEEGEGSYLFDQVSQKMGKVVRITQAKHCRKSVGFLKQYDTKCNLALFSPRDSRIPRILVPLVQCPTDFVEDKRKYDSSMFAVQIIDWKPDCPYAEGNLLDCLGDSSGLKTQIEALLIENDITQTDEFPKEAIECLPLQDFEIPKEEFSKRRDFREVCIFTIDPSTARDMDDALHCRQIDDEVFEVGVHIADVSYFVKENSPLDIEARSRATSVYLTHQVIRMLPSVLADKLCSLNPGVDRLTLSVVFKMGKSCEPYDIWFGRSIIHSCIKMHYELAGEIIQNPSKDWTGDLKDKLFGQATKTVVDSLLSLSNLAEKMRENRIKNGSLILKKIKLDFSMDPESGHPIGFRPYVRHTSHFLIEEFMLLANQLVARKLAEHFPEHAMLRCHPPPNQYQLETKLQRVCQDFKIPMNISSAGSIMNSLHSYSQNHDADETCILSNLCSIPMKLAEYVRLREDTNTLHYALNFAHYTHFTSPIRRYPDLVVHRQLAAALDQGPPLAIEELEYNIIPEHCNDTKTKAKRASYQCNMLFFAFFLHNTEPIIESGRVMKVLDASFDVMLTRIGIEVRVYCERMVQDGVATKFVFITTSHPYKLVITWKRDDATFDQDLKLFSLVKVRVSCLPRDFKLEGLALPPEKAVENW